MAAESGCHQVSLTPSLQLATCAEFGEEADVRGLEPARPSSSNVWLCLRVRPVGGSLLDNRSRGSPNSKSGKRILIRDPWHQQRRPRSGCSGVPGGRGNCEGGVTFVRPGRPGHHPHLRSRATRIQCYRPLSKRWHAETSKRCVGKNLHPCCRYLSTEPSRSHKSSTTDQ